ncbi:hypothetical protein VTK56DRAFT_1940 [Thermocarpiscus australiensis]
MTRRQGIDESQPLLAASADDVVAERGLQAGGGTVDRAAEASVGAVPVQADNASWKNVRARLKFVFPSLAIGIFLAAADQTIIVSSYGRIGSSFDELDKTAWLATAYLCTTTSFQPLYGRLADIFGRKSCLLFTYSVFGLGALLCGLASSMNQLIMARALTGVGAGGIITLVSILLSDIVSLEERGIWQGHVNMVFATGAGLGAPLGGVLTDVVGWRWAFIAQAPLCALAILLISVLLRIPPTSTVPSPDSHEAGKNSSKTLLSQVDFLGAATLISSLVALLLFLDRVSATTGIEASSSSSASASSYLHLLAGSIIAFCAFLYVERNVAIQPLAPLRLLFGREFLGAYLALAFGNVAWYGVIFYVPLLYQASARFSPSMAGTLLLPGISSAIVGGFVGGAILRRRGGSGFRALALGSYPLVAAACAGVAAAAGLFAGGADSRPSLAAILLVISLSLFVGGLGNGGGMTATLVVVVAVASPEDQAVATACVYLYRQLGATVGLAVISMVFRRVLAATLVRSLGGVDSDEIVRRLLESLDYLQLLPGETRVVVERAYSEACRAALLVCTALAVGAIALSCFINEKRSGGRPNVRAQVMTD